MKMMTLRLRECVAVLTRRQRRGLEIRVLKLRPSSCKMGVTRHTFLLLSLLLSVVTYVLGDHSFENEAIVRTVEVGGAVVRTKTTYAVKALDSASSIYVFALSAYQHEKLAGMEAKIKGGEKLALQNYGFNAGRCVNKLRSIIIVVMDEYLTFKQLVFVRRGPPQTTQEGGKDYY